MCLSNLSNKAQLGFDQVSVAACILRCLYLAHLQALQCNERHEVSLLGSTDKYRTKQPFRELRHTLMMSWVRTQLSSAHNTRGLTVRIHFQWEYQDNRKIALAAEYGLVHLISRSFIPYVLDTPCSIIPFNKISEVWLLEGMNHHSDAQMNWLVSNMQCPETMKSRSAQCIIDIVHRNRIHHGHGIRLRCWVKQKRRAWNISNALRKGGIHRGADKAQKTCSRTAHHVEVTSYERNERAYEY